MRFGPVSSLFARLEFEGAVLRDRTRQFPGFESAWNALQLRYEVRADDAVRASAAPNF